MPSVFVCQALECCDEGAYLLANQPMDKCQSREGAQRALQDIEKFLESSAPHLNANPQALYSDYELILTADLKVGPRTSTGSNGGKSSITEPFPAWLSHPRLAGSLTRWVAIQSYFKKRVPALRSLRATFLGVSLVEHQWPCF